MRGIKRQMDSENRIHFKISNKEQIDIETLNKLANRLQELFIPCSYEADSKHHIFSFDTSGTLPLSNVVSVMDAKVILSDYICAINECFVQGLPHLNILVSPSTVFVQEGHLRLIVLPLERCIMNNYKSMFSKAIKLLIKEKKVCKQLLHIVKNSMNENACLQELRSHMNIEHHIDSSSESETTFLGADTESETTFLRDDTEFETMFLDSENEPEIEVKVSAILIRNKTGHQTLIHKPVFKIGNIGSNVDLQVQDNPSISRHHASIMITEHKCFIIDNNSTNKTFVEGAAIPPFEKIELDNGALFTLGNENFQVFMEVR